MDYSGDYAEELYSFNHGIAGGQGIARYLNRSFDAGLEINFGQVKGDNAGPRGNKGVKQSANFQAVLINFNIIATYKFANGYLLKESSIISPYLLAGTGAIYASTAGANSRHGTFNDEVLAVNFCSGAGLKFNISRKTGIYIQSLLLMPQTDKMDGWYPKIPPNEVYDLFLINVIGVTLTPGK